MSGYFPDANLNKSISTAQFIFTLSSQLPPLDQLHTDPFNWVYQCRHAHSGLVTELEPLDHPVNASIHLSGSATHELTPEKPEDGAVVAIAGERGAVWLGLVEHTS